ncbi:hypothetical protein WI93_12070 [Burkholderia vietnamiensis]|uniref:hypothetical protein n=1 Tax=Burkholderia vietnamiensis TaxID=60552 RepID=UPI0007569177|nr:hypothetical protein [Burkholderia vietnamiensis]KVE27762.1 hypothetical protein WI93_12070 [Burkholderia vietnamiensis]
MPNDNVLTDLQIMEALEAAGVKWQEQRSLANDREILTYGSTPAAHIIAGIRALLAAHPGQPEPRASAGVIAAALAVIEADRAQTLTNEHVDALDIAIKIQRGMFKLPEPRAEVTDDDKRDADRYRLLKSIPFGPGVPADYRGIYFSFAVSDGKPGFIRSCRGEDMDAAIDAARAGGKQ